MSSQTKGLPFNLCGESLSACCQSPLNGILTNSYLCLATNSSRRSSEKFPCTCLIVFMLWELVHTGLGLSKLQPVSFGLLPCGRPIEWQMHVTENKSKRGCNWPSMSVWTLLESRDSQVFPHVFTLSLWVKLMIIKMNPQHSNGCKRCRGLNTVWSRCKCKLYIDRWTEGPRTVKYANVGMINAGVKMHKKCIQKLIPSFLIHKQSESNSISCFFAAFSNSQPSAVMHLLPCCC